MRMHILGSGTPTPAATRHGSSYVIEVAGKHVMFDCGPSTTSKLAKAGMDAGMIDELYFTHHHFDHNADYPCFLLSRWDQSIDDSNPLKVFGPDYTQEFTRRLMDQDVGAFAPDWIARINHPLSLNAHRKRAGHFHANHRRLTLRTWWPGTRSVRRIGRSRPQRHITSSPGLSHWHIDWTQRRGQSSSPETRVRARALWISLPEPMRW